MYLHIGGNRMIDVRRLVALFKAHPSRASKSNPLMQYYKPYEYVGNSTEKIGTYVVHPCLFLRWSNGMKSCLVWIERLKSGIIRCYRSCVITGGQKRRSIACRKTRK